MYADRRIESGLGGAGLERYRHALILYPEHGSRLDTMHRLASALVCARREDVLGHRFSKPGQPERDARPRGAP